MSDTSTENTPFLDHVKLITMERIVSHMNGVGGSIVQKYPMAEVESWPVQKVEAEAAILIGEAVFKSQTVEQANTLVPFLSTVTAVHYGEADDTTRLSQLWNKVLAVKANADAWAGLSAYVNGLRARTSDRIDAAVTIDEVYIIESETFTELEAFRLANSV